MREYQKLISKLVILIFGYLGIISAIIFLYHIYLGASTNDWGEYKEAFIASSFILVTSIFGIVLMRIIQRAVFGSE